MNSSRDAFRNSKTKRGETPLGSRSRDQRTDQLIKRVGDLEVAVRTIPELERVIETQRRRISVLERRVGV